LITIKNLVKKYKNFTAVDNLNLTIDENEVFGLLGPNGAGKTTTIHMLATLLKPSSGTAIVNGYDIVNEASKVRASIGIIFQAPSSDDILTGYENLKVHSLLYAVQKGIREKRIAEVLELAGLTERKDDQVKKYSGGMRRRLEIARGLLHKPKVIFLDEPTLGLDPASREIMWRYIQRLVKEEKVTIILTTHYMEEADLLCDRIGIIDKGKIIALDTPSRLKESIGGDSIRIQVSSNSNLNFAALSGFDFIRKADFVNDGRVIILSVYDAIRNLPVLLKNANNVDSVEYSIPTLNDVFLQLTGREMAEDEHSEGGFMERYAEYGK
jgi:ABC-2 type transport system ATP-binding protein